MFLPHFLCLTNARDCGILTVAIAALAHLVERHLAKVEVASSSLVSRSKKQEHCTRSALVFCVCVRRAQHRLRVYSQHHFSQSENIVFRLRTQNDVMLRINDVMLRINDVMLRINDVMLRINDVMLRINDVLLRRNDVTACAVNTWAPPKDVALRANVWYNPYYKRGDSNERR